MGQPIASEQEEGAGLSTFGRLILAAKTILARIFRPQRNKMMDVWTRGMTVFVSVYLIISAVAAVFDEPVLNAVYGSTHWFFNFLASITDAAKSHFYLVPALIIMVFVSAQNWAQRSIKRRGLLTRAYERSAFLFVAIALPGIAINICKQFIGRGRPRTIDEYGPYVFSPFEFSHVYQSFPSGHSATAGSLGMVLALHYPSLRWPILFVFFVLAFARVAAGAHYISDVFVGYLFGALGTLVIARWLCSRALTFRSQNGSVFPQFRK